MAAKHAHKPGLMPPELEKHEFTVNFKERKLLTQKRYTQLANRLIGKSVLHIASIIATFLIVVISNLLNIQHDVLQWLVLLMAVAFLVVAFPQMKAKYHLIQAANTLKSRKENEAESNSEVTA